MCFVFNPRLPRWAVHPVGAARDPEPRQVRLCWRPRAEMQQESAVRAARLKQHGRRRGGRRDTLGRVPSRPVDCRADLDRAMSAADTEGPRNRGPRSAGAVQPAASSPRRSKNGIRSLDRRHERFRVVREQKRRTARRRGQSPTGLPAQYAPAASVTARDVSAPRPPA
jgi:hypothetical protein